MSDRFVSRAPGQGQKSCPLDPILRVLSKKWLVNVVWVLGEQSTARFAQIKKSLPGKISARVLSVRLKELERYKLIERRDLNLKSPHVNYRLTATGVAFHKVLLEIEKKFGPFFAL